ncbi:MAG: DsrE/DsrF/DrsH-like family protein [Candidatus Eremiobacterota bacterium]
MQDKLSIVLFSGTVDKLMAASIIATGAAAMGKQVNLFLTFWGLLAFKKDAWKTNQRMSNDFEDYAAAAAQAMREKKVPSWLETLKNGMELGNIKVQACGMTVDLFGLKREDLEDVVSDITGVASFVSESEGGQTLFI